MNFLETVAHSLYNKHRHQLHRLAVVFPNRRQSIFFRHYFSGIADAPAFIPQLLTIEELVQQSSDLPVADNLLQVFELYNAYKSVSLGDGEQPEQIPDFEQFYPIGETLVKDFREIDSYQLEVDEVCSVLYDIESIEKSFEQLTDEQKAFLKSFWTSITNKGRAQERFLSLWKRLPAIYQLFHKGLVDQGFTTLGKIYRDLADQPLSENSFTDSWDHIAFVGFNAFNRAEENVLKAWQDYGLASLWVDCDRYYLENPRQEAGFFLRRNFNIVGLRNDLPVLDRIGSTDMPVTVTAVQGQGAQAKTISSWLSQFPATGPVDSAAIVLADETLIQPVLQSLPGNNVPVNVTLGFPLTETAIFSFINLYFEIQVNLTAHHGNGVHFEIVEKWLSHPLCDWPEAIRSSLLQKIQQQRLVMVPIRNLEKQSDIGNLLFARLNAEIDIFSRLRQMLQFMQKLESLKSDDLLQGALVAAWQVLQMAEPLFEQLKPRPSFNMLMQVLRRHLSTVTIPFEGEPLKGIQVMGLLESRGLDFKHILLLGAAEGGLPRVHPPQTFLPDGVRRAFGMPVTEFQDAIFAYTFYRLFHRCENMHLVYNNLVSVASTAEPSRFIRQLAFESKMSFQYQFPGTVIKPSARPVISIQKTPEILRMLNKYFEGEGGFSFSPSQVNSYLTCRLQFFFSRIAMLKKPDLLTEEVDPATLGTIVHELMEELYRQVEAHQGNKLITESSIDWMRDKIPVLIEPAFRKAWMGDKAKSPVEFVGILDVIRQVVVQYVEGFLAIDRKYCPFTVDKLEDQLKQPFSLQVNGHERKIFLNGYVDRIDEKSGVYRMVDYKTGGDKTEFKNVELLFEREGRNQNKAALQTLIYSWMFQQNYPGRKSFEPALVPLRSLKKDDENTRLVMKEGKSAIAVTATNIAEVLEDVEEHLRATLEEIFDPAIEFNQTEDLKACAYCDFAGICRRN